MFSLDDIRIASPCKSDWTHMYGDDRRRFCGECKLNVYNLSGMTRDEAERLVMNSEGRLCVRFFRRRDGTVLTQDCPVGWKAVKKRVSGFAVAVSSVLAGFFAGVFSLGALDMAIGSMPIGDVEQPGLEKKNDVFIMGEVEDLVEWEGKVSVGEVDYPPVAQGRVGMVQPMQDVKVKAWVK